MASPTRKTFEALAASIRDMDLARMLVRVEREPNHVDLVTGRLDNRSMTILRRKMALTVADALVSESDAFDPVKFVTSAVGEHIDRSVVARHSTRLAIRVQATR